MAKACKELNIPFIHLSSEYVFDGTGDKPKSPDDKPKPINQYGLSKLASEKLVMEAFNKAIIIRTSWIFSASGKILERMLNCRKLDLKYLLSLINWWTNINIINIECDNLDVKNDMKIIAIQAVLDYTITQGGRRGWAEFFENF